MSIISFPPTGSSAIEDTTKVQARKPEEEPPPFVRAQCEYKEEKEEKIPSPPYTCTGSSVRADHLGPAKVAAATREDVKIYVFPFFVAALAAPPPGATSRSYIAFMDEPFVFGFAQ